MATRNLELLSFDLGASNGRAVLGRFDGERLVLEEMHRFENGPVDIDGIPHWDAASILGHLKSGFSAYRAQGGTALSAFGIDTWGVDYGLLDAKGLLLANPRAYRASTDAAMNAAWDVVPKLRLFDRCGLAAMNFNTVYQLYRRKLDGDEALEKARTLLLMPDLLGYLLTGEKKTEYTNATTTNLYNPRERNWDWATLRELGLPERLFTEIDRAGQLRGRLTSAVAKELSLGRTPFAAVGTHDTASAVAAIPGHGNFAFCSSGTWSLFGVETDEPVLTDAMYDGNFSNEGTVQGGFRPLKNIMGLWPLQECRREWNAGVHKLSWDEIEQAAEAATPFRSLVDPDWGPFFAAGDMTDKIRRYCRATKQPVPDSVGEVARCIFESLAVKYRWAVERLEGIKGAPLDTLHIVGGGVKQKILNRMAADATGRRVVTGPTEGACAGNLLMQAVALGELAGLDEAREVVLRSFETHEYEPHPTQEWQDAYAKLLRLMDTEVTT